MATINPDAAGSRGDIMARLDRHDREIRDLQTARRGEAMSIGRGGIRVQGGSIVIQDTGGDDQVRLGPLSTGGFGLEQRVVDTFVPLAALAGGALVDQEPAIDQLDAAAGVDTGFVDLDPAGPSVTFTTHTGKWAVLINAITSIPTNGGSGWMGYAATGAQTLIASALRSAFISLDTGLGFFSQVFMNVHEGNPGVVTVTSKYRVVAPGGSASSSSWQSRGMLIIPY